MLRTAPRTRHLVIYTVLLCLAILTPLTAIQAAQTGQPRIVNVSLLTSAQVSTTPAQNVLDSNRMGIEPYAAVSANMWLVSVHHAQTLGFGWLKLSVAWKDIEPTKGTFSAQLALLKQNILYAKSQS